MDSRATGGLVFLSFVLLAFFLIRPGGEGDGSSSAQPLAPPVEAGPLVGGVTDTGAVFVLKASRPASVRILLSEDSLFALAALSEMHRAEDSTYRYVQIAMGGLRPNRRYFYRPVVDDVAAEPVHSFRTFPAPEKAAFSFGFGSCQQGPWGSNPLIFPVIAQDSIRFFIHLGDWTYPDYLVSPRFSLSMDLEAKAYDVRYDSRYPFIRDVLTRIPIAYVYDDHDYAGNDADGTAPGKANSLRAYAQFFPHYPLANPQNGIWQKFTFGDVEFFLLDLRSQRSKNREAFTSSGRFRPPRGHSILAGFRISGQDQKSWLLESLRSSTAQWKIIASSVVFNPVYREALMDQRLTRTYPQIRKGVADKWAGFPADVSDLLQTIRKNDIKNVIIISGDSHSSYIDDGRNSSLPEISSSNLDVRNSGIGTLLLLAGFDAWDRGSYNGQGFAYGRMTFVYGKEAYALLEVVDNLGVVVASCRIPAR